MKQLVRPTELVSDLAAHWRKAGGFTSTRRWGLAEWETLGDPPIRVTFLSEEPVFRTVGDERLQFVKVAAVSRAVAAGQGICEQASSDLYGDGRSAGNIVHILRGC